MDNLVDLDDFDDDDFDASSWGGQSHQDTVSETLSARNHDEEDDHISSKKNDYIPPKEERNPHESEEMDPMMFGQVDHNESFDNFDDEHFEDSHHQEEEQGQDSPAIPVVRTLDDLEDSDDDFDENFELSDDEEEEDEQTNSFRIVKKNETPPKEEQISIPTVASEEEKQVTESFESNESSGQLENVNFEKQYRTLDDYDDYSDEEPVQEEFNDNNEDLEKSQNTTDSDVHQELQQNLNINQPFSQSIRSDSYRNFEQKSAQEQNFAKTLPPKINYKQQEPQKEVIPNTFSATSTIQKLSQPTRQQTLQPSIISQSSFQPQQEQQSTIASQKQTLQTTLSSQQLTLQSNQNSTLQKQNSTLKFTLPSTYSPKSDNNEDDLENYNPIQSIKISPKVKPLPKNVNIETNTIIEDNRSDKSSSSTKSVPISSQPTSKENLEKVFLSLKSKEDFKVRESEITSPKRPVEKKREERILKEDCIFYPVKENQTKYISLEDVAKRNNTLRAFNMETIMSETLSRKTSKHQVDLRDEKILQLVLDLYFSVSKHLITKYFDFLRMV